MTPAQEKLLRAIRACGVDSTDLRHAVHEAHHALDAKLPAGKWDTWALDRAIKRMGPGRAAASEIAARAAEQVVCERLGLKTKPLDEWVGTSVMEAIKFRDPFLSYDQALEAAKRRLSSPDAQKDADRIMALADAPAPKKRRPKKSSPNACPDHGEKA